MLDIDAGGQGLKASPDRDSSAHKHCSGSDILSPRWTTPASVSGELSDRFCYQTDRDTNRAAAQPPAQQIRLRWANQVDALPPAYQAAGAGVLNDILGPSAQQTGTGVVPSYISHVIGTAPFN